jgi:hypothetical protein
MKDSSKHVKRSLKVLSNRQLQHPIMHHFVEDVSTHQCEKCQLARSAHCK